MSINILAQLDKLIGDGAHFRGAVFLTYSLNLHFFEQLIQPKLEALGCTHVVILADVFGYQEEVRRSLHQLSGVGRQYICAPVYKHTRGVQHSKLLMLVSEHQGWMVGGSGNLTLFGYGQNLELFDLFESDNRRSETELAYPFQTAWRSINSLVPALAKTAQEHLEHFASLAPWLNSVSPPPDDFALWDSFDRPLYDQLTKYDLLAKLGRVDELHLIAPFIDIGQFAD